MAFYRDNYPRRPGGLAEQHRSRFRNHITEQIAGQDWEALADRTAPLPSDVPLDQLMSFFEAAYKVQMWDLWEPGWDERARARGGRY